MTTQSMILTKLKMLLTTHKDNPDTLKHDPNNAEDGPDESVKDLAKSFTSFHYLEFYHEFFTLIEALLIFTRISANLTGLAEEQNHNRELHMVLGSVGPALDWAEITAERYFFLGS